MIKRIIIITLTVLIFVVPVQADPVLYEGEAIASWAGDGKDDTPYQSELNVNYDLQRCQQKDGKNPKPNPGKFKIYFKSTLLVLNQMDSGGVQIVWSGEYVEDEEL
jgi:hypothetical protein